MFFKRLPNISTKELESKLEEQLQIIDVRESYEFTSGHIPGAKNIPLGKINNFKPTGKTYVVCQSGARSRMAAKYLMRNGYDVVNVRGGMNAWSGKTRSGKL